MARRQRVALAAGIAVSAGLLGISTPAAYSVSCIGPSLSVQPPVEPPRTTPIAAVVVRGEAVIVYGEWFRNGCDDTGRSGCRGPADPESPKTNIELRLVQAGRAWALATADASDRDGRYAVSWPVTIPTGAESGSATLETADASLDVQVR